MTRRSSFLAVVALTMLASAAGGQPEPASQPEKVKIKHAFPPGAYTLTVLDKADTTTTVGQQEQKATSAELQVWELNVAPSNDKDDKQMTLKLLRIGSIEQGEKKTAFDSDKPADDQDPGLAFVYKPLLGRPIQVTLDSDDTVVEVTGLDKLWTELSAKAGTDEQKSALAQVQIGLCDKAIEQELRRWESLMPRGAVAAGDQWKAGIRMDLPVIGEIKARYDCKLEGLDSDSKGARLAVIAAQGQYETTSSKTVKIQGHDVTVAKIDVQEKSTVKVDPKTGLTQFDQKSMTMVADLKAKDEKGNDVTFNVKRTGTTKTTLEPKQAGGKIVVPGFDEGTAPKGGGVTLPP